MVLHILKEKLFSSLIILCTLFHSSFLSFSQQGNIRFEHISLEQGLSQSYVTSIIQDQKGFLWFATQDGLNRYDGYNIKVFRPSPNNSKSISSDRINHLLLDGNMIWLTTRGGGLVRFDSEKETFMAYTYDPENLNTISHNETTMIIKDNHKLWIGTNGGGVNLFDPDKESFTRFKHHPKIKTSVSSNYVQTIYIDSKNRIWIGTLGGGLNLYDRKNNRFISYTNTPNNDNSLSGNNIFSICEDDKNKLWIGTEKNGLNSFDPEKNIFKRFLYNCNDNSINNNRILSLFVDKENNIWIGTEGGGINLYNQNSNKFNYFLHDPNNKYSLNNNRIWSIFQDRSGIMWFGTWGGGVNKLNINSKKFTHYKHEPDNKNSLNDNVVYPIFEDKNGIIWIGTQKGLNMLDRNQNKFEHFEHDPLNPNSISANDVYAIIEDHKGIFWIGTWGGGLNKFNRANKKFVQVPLISNGEKLVSYNVMSLLEDHNNELWVGTEVKGLFRLDKNRKAIKNYKNKPGDSNSLSHNDIFYLYEDSSNDLWVGTWTGGLNIFNKQTETFTQILHDPYNSNSLSSNSIFVITEDLVDPNTLWIGTSKGLNKYNKVSNTFGIITKANGICNNFIYSALEDNNDNLWLTTNQGLAKFNKITNDVINYHKDDGLQSNEFNSWGFCKTRNGEFFLGGINGITTFFPDSIKSNQFKPPIAITGFKIFNENIGIKEEVNGRILLNNSIVYTDKIELSYKDYVFSLDFVALNYELPEKNKYAYILEGFEKKWNYVGNRRYASYSNLPHGKYKFKVIASNNDGIWNNNGISLDIVVTPPFWRTLWFRILFIILVIGIIYSWVIWRINNINKQKTELEKQVSKRTKELRESNATKDKIFSIISHDLKSPFNSILGFSEILSENFNLLSKDKGEKFAKQIHGSAKQFFNLLENLLEWSNTKTERITFHPKILILKDIIINIINIQKLNATEKNIKIETNINKDVKVFADPNFISIVIRNLISNALKFSEPDSIIQINTKENNGFIEISVNDSGLGISEENIDKLFREDIHFTTMGTNKEKGSGLGLILCKEFVERSGGKIWVESNEGKGTAFYFTLPKPS